MLLQVIPQQLAAKPLPHGWSSASQQLRFDEDTDHFVDGFPKVHQQDERPCGNLRTSHQGGYRASHVGGMIAGPHQPEKIRVLDSWSHVL